MRERGGGGAADLYKEVSEGEKVNLFSVYKWALKTRVKNLGKFMVGCTKRRDAGRRRGRIPKR